MFDGLLAGICISIGGSVFLSCENKYIGAVLFSVALLCICIKKYNLYTGKICYIIESHKKYNISNLFLGLLGNTLSVIVCGYILAFSSSTIKERALTLCNLKLSQSFLQTSIKAFFCGILIYLAVSIYHEKTTITGIIFCIPTFILCGFEHSIADIFYFSASGIVSFEAFLYLITVILGNTVGGILIPSINILKGMKCFEKYKYI